MPNVYLVSQNHEELPTPTQFSPIAATPTEEVVHHKSVFYEPLQLYYSTNNQRKLMGQNQLNSIIEVVKGVVTFTKGDAKQATVHYKYKIDFVALSFGDHYSLVRSEDVVGRTAIDISTVPRYVCFTTLIRRVTLESGRQKSL